MTRLLNTKNCQNFYSCVAVFFISCLCDGIVHRIARFFPSKLMFLVRYKGPHGNHPQMAYGLHMVHLYRGSFR